MRYDTFAFFNQQLSTMLGQGIPLEGALRQLCSSMERGELRNELEALGAELQKGVPLIQAIGRRKLPAFYVQMLRMGTQSNDLAGTLLMLADYYRQVDNIWTRLKGLMVYPVLVLIAACAVSGLFTFLISNAASGTLREFGAIGINPTPAAVLIQVWAPTIVIAGLLVGTVVCLWVPAVRRHAFWRLPAFKEAKLAQVAAAMSLMLKSGGNFADSLGMAQEMEKGSCAEAELSRWRRGVAEGRQKFTSLATPGTAFPPLFIWLVGNAGEDLAGGFRHAAEIYGARAIHRTEMFLYAALPFSVIALGLMIISQTTPVMRIFVAFMNMLGDTGLGE